MAALQINNECTKIDSRQDGTHTYIMGSRERAECFLFCQKTMVISLFQGRNHGLCFDRSASEAINSCAFPE
jgi:hypothetical protein